MRTIFAIFALLGLATVAQCCPPAFGYGGGYGGCYSYVPSYSYIQPSYAVAAVQVQAVAIQPAYTYVQPVQIQAAQVTAVAIQPTYAYTQPVSVQAVQVRAVAIQPSYGYCAPPVAVPYSTYGGNFGVGGYGGNYGYGGNFGIGSYGSSFSRVNVREFNSGGRGGLLGGLFGGGRGEREISINRSINIRRVGR